MPIQSGHILDTNWPTSSNPICSSCQTYTTSCSLYASAFTITMGSRQRCFVDVDAGSINRLLNLHRAAIIWAYRICACIHIWLPSATFSVQRNRHNLKRNIKFTASRFVLSDVSVNHRGRAGNEKWSHRYICAARWPLENNRIIWWAQVLRTEI